MNRKILFNSINGGVSKMFKTISNENSKNRQIQENKHVEMNLIESGLLQARWFAPL